MSILYACSKCREMLGGISGSSVVNEVGRKSCEGCGANHDNLESFNSDSLTARINAHNKKLTEPKVSNVIDFPHVPLCLCECCGEDQPGKTMKIGDKHVFICIQCHIKEIQTMLKDYEENGKQIMNKLEELGIDI